MAKRHESAITVISALLGALFLLGSIGSCAMIGNSKDLSAGPSAAVLLALAVGMFTLSWRAGRPRQYDPVACPACGTVGEPNDVLRGDGGVELLLWLCFVIPGFIYSSWRYSGDRRRCAGCGAAGVVPLDTPRGREIAEKASSLPGPSK